MLDHRSRLHRLLESNPWMLMAGIVSVMFIVALGLVRLDHALKLTPDPDQVWFYGGGADASIGLLSAITSSSITVAGVIFSATFVTMQLASSSYTPRVVQALSRRWNLQVVLGIFLADFVFALVVLRSVRPVTETRAPEFVPVLSVSACILFSFICVGVFVYYVSYGFRSLQPTFLIDSAVRETIGLLERSQRVSEGVRQVSPGAREAGSAENPHLVVAAEAGFLQRVQFNELQREAEAADVSVRIIADIGRYYFPGEPILAIVPGDRWSMELQDAVLRTVALGDERTPEQDIEFAFRRVADIMLKAISPAINDPTTSEYCINTLGKLILMLASQPAPLQQLVDGNDVIRVTWSQQPFARCVNTAFDQFRHYGSRDISLVAYTLQSFRRLASLLPVGHRAVIVAQAVALRDTALAEVGSEGDRQIVNRASSWLTTASAHDV